MSDYMTFEEYKRQSANSYSDDYVAAFERLHGIDIQKFTDDAMQQNYKEYLKTKGIKNDSTNS